MYIYYTCTVGSNPFPSATSLYVPKGHPVLHSFATTYADMTTREAENLGIFKYSLGLPSGAVFFNLPLCFSPSGYDDGAKFDSRSVTNLWVL